MRRISAVRPGHDIPAEAGRAAGAPVATSATVRQTRSNGGDLRDVPPAVLRDWAPAVGARELALEQLPAAPDSAKRVTADNEAGGIGRHSSTAARPDLIDERFGDAFI